MARGPELQERVNDLWRRYKESGSVQLRNEIVLHYVSLVRYIASKVAVGLPPNVDRDDLVSYGLFGLIDAIQKFDLTKGVKFETYAIVRIRGAIIDELRGQDRVPRSVRSKARALERATADFETEHGHAPDDGELAGRMDLTVIQLWALQSDAAVASVISLEEHQGDNRPSINDSVCDVASNPEDLFGQDEITSLLAVAIDRLSIRSKTILALYYVEELTLAGIGNVLGVTESRVCQLQGQLLTGLREALAHGAAA